MNTHHRIRQATGAVLTSKSERMRLVALTNLEGVSVPTASAILTLLNPKRYGVIDIRVWQLLHRVGVVDGNPGGTNFTFEQWERFLAVVRRFAGHFRVQARDIERTLFLIHREYQDGLLYPPPVRFRKIVAMAVVAMSLCGVSSAQANPSLLPLGIRVKVSVSTPPPASAGLAPDAASEHMLRERIIGTLVNIQDETLIVNEGKDGPRREVPLASVNRFEVSRGRHSSSGKGALIGMFAGAAGGVAAGYVVCNHGNCDSSTGDLTGIWASALGLGGALFGAGIGAIIGGVIHTERWEKVSVHDLRVGIGPVGRECLGLRVAIAFH
ncbi:MAG TPA: hypothetical protein VK527_06300 [Candidatus Limnocylindrales bacterium]|nr:hypothetical protein [Candidatus Limnocylindrales bacterium]